MAIDKIQDGEIGAIVRGKLNQAIKKLNDADTTVTQGSDELVTSGAVFEHTEDFITDSDVSNNADVSANTAARHEPVTLEGAPNYLTLVGQVITRNLINLANHVTGRLGFSNLPTGTARSIVGRAGSGNGDVANITVAESRIVGRLGSGNITGLTGDEVRGISSAEKRGLNGTDLGSVSGSVAISLASFTTFTLTTTDDITLSFTNVPTGGAGIVIDITGDDQITWPSGANAVDGEIPEPDGDRYKYILTVRADDDYDVDGIIDNIEAVV